MKRKPSIMKITASVSALLQNKRAELFSVTPETTVFDAIKLMAHKNIGAVVVMSGDKLMGMLSERDYTRKVVLQGRSSKDTWVREIVSQPVITVTPHSTVDECMKLMTEKRIRHLPVVDAGKVVGLISIGDLVNWIISSQHAAIEQMEQYISGGFPQPAI